MLVLSWHVSSVNWGISYHFDWPGSAHTSASQLALAFGIRHLAFGIGIVGFGIWHLAFGICAFVHLAVVYLAFGIWHVVFGIWHLAFGIRIRTGTRICIRIRHSYWPFSREIGARAFFHSASIKSTTARSTFGVWILWRTTTPPIECR